MLFLQASYSYFIYTWLLMKSMCWLFLQETVTPWSLVFGYIKICPSDLLETFATRNHAWGHGHGWASHALDTHLVHLWSAPHQRHFEEKDRESNCFGGWDDWQKEMIRMNKWRFQDLNVDIGRKRISHAHEIAFASGGDPDDSETGKCLSHVL